MNEIISDIHSSSLTLTFVKKNQQDEFVEISIYDDDRDLACFVRRSENSGADCDAAITEFSQTSCLKSPSELKEGDFNDVVYMFENNPSQAEIRAAVLDFSKKLKTLGYHELKKIDAWIDS